MFEQETNISFNDMPQALAYLIGKVDNIESLLSSIPSTKAEPTDRWFNLQELCDYHPDHPAKQTVYGWVSQHIIPYHKDGKKLRFLKSEIDAWLNSGAFSSTAELQADALQFINAKKLVK